MDYNPDKAANSLVRIGKILNRELSGDRWSVVIEPGSRSPFAIGAGNALPEHIIIHDMETLQKALPPVAYPVVFTRIDGIMTLRLAGIEVLEPELADMINDMSLIQKSLPVSNFDNQEAFSFGKINKLRPGAAELTVMAHSPIEAVMKFIITRVPISEMNTMPLRHPDIDYKAYEMRSQKDWSPVPFADAYFFACKYLTATLVTHALSRRLTA